MSENDAVIPDDANRLQVGQWLARVLEVEGGTGDPSVESNWSTTLVMPNASHYPVAERAARRWWNETDQCGECVVTLEVVHAAGWTRRFRVRVRVRVRVVATAEELR